MTPANMNIESGVLAMVFGLLVDTDWNGKIVTVVSHGKQHESDTGIDIWTDWTPGWWICSHPDGENGLEMFHQKNLMPIIPEEDPLDVKVERELEMKV